jgi:hypothetical protein
MFVCRIVRSARAVLGISGIFTLLFAILAPRIARSQSLPQQELEETGLAQREVKTWDIFLGAAVASTNTYEGANSGAERVIRESRAREIRGKYVLIVTFLLDTERKAFASLPLGAVGDAGERHASSINVGARSLSTYNKFIAK